jgi:hypothetical protein
MELLVDALEKPLVDHGFLVRFADFDPENGRMNAQNLCNSIELTGLVRHIVRKTIISKANGISRIEVIHTFVWEILAADLICVVVRGRN